MCKSYFCHSLSGTFTNVYCLATWALDIRAWFYKRSLSGEICLALYMYICFMHFCIKEFIMNFYVSMVIVLKSDNPKTCFISSYEFHCVYIEINMCPIGCLGTWHRCKGIGFP